MFPLLHFFSVKSHIFNIIKFSLLVLSLSDDAPNFLAPRQVNCVSQPLGTGWHAGTNVDYAAFWRMGHIHQCSVITPGSVLPNHSRWRSWDHMKCQRSNRASLMQGTCLNACTISSAQSVFVSIMNEFSKLSFLFFFLLWGHTRLCSGLTTGSALSDHSGIHIWCPL